MKILQILPALGQGGVERGTVEIAAALVKAGIESAVVSNGGPMVAQLEKLGVKHYTLLHNLGHVKPIKRKLYYFTDAKQQRFYFFGSH